MRRFVVCAVLFFCQFPGYSYSPAPTGDYYGGQIFFKNTSSHDLYIELYFNHNPFGGFSRDRFCLEKRDRIVEYHQFFVPYADVHNFDVNSAHPNNYFNKICMYDLGTGELLAEIDVSDKKIFTLISGGMEGGAAVFELAVEDSFLTKGN